MGRHHDRGGSGTAEPERSIAPAADSEALRRAALPGSPGLDRLIGWYQVGHEDRPSPCRFVPSCSTYALEAVEAHGAVKGSFLAVRRLLRCHPWGGHGFDPVPRRHPLAWREPTVVFDLIATVLAWFYSLVPNYAFAIAMMTILIMLLLTPLTLKSTKSMLELQRIQPEMKRIQQEYKGDRQP